MSAWQPMETAPMISDLTPLTASKWWDFAPWQDMDTAPRDGTKVIMKFISSKMFLIDSPRCSDIRDDVKWLPLPKAG